MIASDRRRRGRQSGLSGSLHRAPLFTDGRLELGRGRALARLDTSTTGAPALRYEGGEERALARLAAAYGHALEASVLLTLESAARDWLGGDEVGAENRLAQAGLTTFERPDLAASRLRLADFLLEAGMTPDELLHALSRGGWIDLFERQSYQPDPQWPADAAPVRRPDGSIIADENPGAEAKLAALHAPEKADFRQVCETGESIAGMNPWEQMKPGWAAIGQGGSFDFQRDNRTMRFIPAYAHASHYAAGVFLAGAGFTERQAIFIFRSFTPFESSAAAREEILWIRRGWADGAMGTWARTGSR